MVRSRHARSYVDAHAHVVEVAILYRWKICGRWILLTMRITTAPCKGVAMEVGVYRVVPTGDEAILHEVGSRRTRPPFRHSRRKRNNSREPKHMHRARNNHTVTTDADALGSSKLTEPKTNNLEKSYSFVTWLVTDKGVYTRTGCAVARDVR